MPERTAHCVVETKRGHTLGSVIWEKEAIPNTGIPGNVGGFTTERLIRASAPGMMKPVAESERLVEKEADCCIYRGKTGLCKNERNRPGNAAAGGAGCRRFENR